MSQYTKTRTLPALLATAALTLVVSGCTGTTDAAPSGPSAIPVDTAPASSTPAASSLAAAEAVAVVEDYLSAIQSEQYPDAYALLSDGAQTLVGSEQQFADSAGISLVRADEAAGYLGSDGRIEAGPGPVDGSVLVTGVRGRSADAWIVRSTPDGARIDDAGVPPTGPSRYEWVNPASGPEDVRDATPTDSESPAALVFTDTADADGGAPDLIGYPDRVTAYVGTAEVPASMAASEAQLRWDIDLSGIRMSSSAAPLTVTWAVGEDTDVWRSTTTALFVD